MNSMKRTWYAVERAQFGETKRLSSSVKPRIATAFTLTGRSFGWRAIAVESAQHLWQSVAAGDLEEAIALQ